MNGAPIYDMLLGLGDGVRLHTPGHKGRLGGIFSEISRYDTTELSCTDNLYAPTGAIEEAERLATAFFGTKNTVFSAGGATLCIQTALSFFRGKKVLFDRNSHISAYNAASALDIDSEYVYGGFSDVPAPPTPEEIDRELNKGGFSAVYITSPNYYGVCADMKRIKKVCTAHKATLITDNAHGTQLYLTDKDNSACIYSDICIDSAHKTLPVLTGGAYLHFRIDIEKKRIKENMRYFGSTSPSFLILASLDFCRSWLEEKGGTMLSACEKRTTELKKSLNSSGIRTTELPLCDRSRLCILANDARGLNDMLEENGIYPEMCSDNAVVMLFSPFNTEHDYEKVLSFFAALPFAVKYDMPDYVAEKPVRAMKYKDAFFAEKEAVSPQAAIGRIAAENIMPYPPGIPVTAAGEIISETAAEILKNGGTDIIYAVKGR